MDLNVATPIAAVVAGLATSVHCTAMCGPLACAMRVRPVEYHLSRVCSYALCGAISGLTGQALVNLFDGQITHVAPWILAAVLLMLAFGLEKRIPQPKFSARLLMKARLDRSLGWLTPLIPCGPMWLLLSASAATGSWSSGALLALAFAIGTVPLPLFLLMQGGRLQQRLSPRGIRFTQQGLALLSAGLLVWRATLPLHACCH